MKKILAFLSVVSINGFAALNAVSCTKQDQTKAIDINKAITNTDLGNIILENDIQLPNKDNINKAIKKVNASYDASCADIKSITNNSAVIQGNNNIDNGFLYTGTTTVTFKTAESTDIKSVIKNTNLNQINLSNQEVPNINQLNDLIKKANTSYDANCASVTNITSTGATIVSNNKIDNNQVYSNSTDIKFTVLNTVDIATVITQPNLGIIDLNNTKTVSIDDINAAIKKVNNAFNSNCVTISNINTNSATINGNKKNVNGTIYQGTINVKFVADDNIDISKVITKTDLGEIDIPSSQKIITDTDINKAILKLNTSYDANCAKVINISATGATIISSDNADKGTLYVGSVDIKFTTIKEVQISSVVTKTNLGEIDLNDELSPSSDEINKAILKLNTSYDANYSTIENITNTSATIVSNNNASNGIIYVGSVDIKFTIKDTLQMQTVINQTDLGTISLSNTTTPTESQINDAIKKVDGSYDANCASVTNIGKTGATIVSNNKADEGITYSGSVDVSFKTNDNIDIASIITKTDLGVMNIANSSIPNNDDLNKALQSLNSNYNSKYTTIENVTSSSATVEGNGQVINGISYVGSVDIKFNAINNIDIASVITDTTLGQIETSDESKPTATEIQNTIKKLNPSYNYNRTDVTNISATGATIVSKTQSSDGAIYTGSIDVTFTTQNDIDISKIITTTDLGRIDLNNTKTVTTDDVNAAISKVNNLYNKACVNVTNITSSSATISTNNANVDGIAYTGSIDVKFASVDNIAMNNVIKKTSLGSIYISSGSIPTGTQINNAIKHYNSSYDDRYAKVTDITSTSANIISNNWNIDGVVYTESAKVTFTTALIQKTYYSKEDYLDPGNGLNLKHNLTYGYDSLIDYSGYDSIDDYFNSNSDIKLNITFDSYTGKGSANNNVKTFGADGMKSNALKDYFGKWTQESYITWTSKNGKRTSYAETYIQLFDDYQDKKILFEFKSNSLCNNEWYDVGNKITISKKS